MTCLKNISKLKLCCENFNPFISKIQITYLFSSIFSKCNSFSLSSYICIFNLFNDLFLYIKVRIKLLVFLYILILLFQLYSISSIPGLSWNQLSPFSRIRHLTFSCILFNQLIKTILSVLSCEKSKSQ